MDEKVAQALSAERAKNARLINTLRFSGVSAFFALFVVLGLILSRPDWQGNLGLFAVYWLASALVFAAGRARDTVARALGLAIAFVDVPVVFELQRAQFATSNAGGVAGFNVGLYMFLLLLGTLALDRRMIFVTAAVATVFEGLLQYLAGISTGAIVATAILFALGAFACAHGSERLTGMLADLVGAEQAQHKNEKLAALGQLSGSIAHDLRNPLTVISMAQELMGDGIKSLETERRDRLGKFNVMIGEQVARCHAFIDHLLNFARERPAQRQPCDLRALSNEASIGVMVPGHVSLTVDVSAGLETVPLDAAMFRRVLTNLLQNAVQAIPEDRAGRVQLLVEPAPGEVVFRVIDDGAGIAAANLQRIFEPLFTTKSTGTGFGLAIVRGIVEQHGGRVDVESVVGEGTTFTLRIPRA